MLFKRVLFTETEKNPTYFCEVRASSLPFKHHHLSHLAASASDSKHKFLTRDCLPKSLEETATVKI